MTFWFVPLLGSTQQLNVRIPNQRWQYARLVLSKPKVLAYAPETMEEDASSGVVQWYFTGLWKCIKFAEMWKVGYKHQAYSHRCQFSVTCSPVNANNLVNPL
jgi:hypothetical protein